MGNEIQVPFTFVVRSVTWRPDGEASPDEPKSTMSIGPYGGVLPIEASLHPDPALDDLIERARREYYEGMAAEAQETRQRAREAEAASWEPTTVPPGGSRLTASLYGNLRQRKRTPAASGSVSRADTGNDPGSNPSRVAGPADAPATTTGSAITPKFG